jgi:hypothetical protein
MKSKMQVLSPLISKFKKLIYKCGTGGVVVVIAIGQLLTIMSRSIAYLTSRVNFVQVSDEIPVTKQRNPEKVDPPDVFEGSVNIPFPFLPPHAAFLTPFLSPTG